ncbi:hypothetical protein T01_16220 [Trichinella spiralis]|uniref:Secreted protein n=1 Tax=Trichinella spiralis TaxID=6334 RepID=A0A0V1BM50_TRISP|nr:hypothetical protein T01_16220 [Trichinella spiralis]
MFDVVLLLRLLRLLRDQHVRVQLLVVVGGGQLTLLSDMPTQLFNLLPDVFSFAHRFPFEPDQLVRQTGTFQQQVVAVVGVGVADFRRVLFDLFAVVVELGVGDEQLTLFVRQRVLELFEQVGHVGDALVGFQTETFKIGPGFGQLATQVDVLFGQQSARLFEFLFDQTTTLFGQTQTLSGVGQFVGSNAVLFGQTTHGRVDFRQQTFGTDELVAEQSTVCTSAVGRLRRRRRRRTVVLVVVVISG